MKTYCNPLPLPDYPLGSATRDNHSPYAFGKDIHSRHPDKRHYRETADPTVLYEDGRWYLYPSCGMAYVSDDFVTWRHHVLVPEDAGYAPTVVKHEGAYYLTACAAPIYRADGPLGPFKILGMPRKPDGTEVEWYDPMLFSDDDGRLYAYWGISAPGIFGAELDPKQPCKMITEPKILFSFDPDHVYERAGDFNEHSAMNFNEGPWMFKHGRRYYLTYATPGTEWRTYSMAAYVSDKALGPFAPQKKNPFLATTGGLVTGPGHGCVVRGPNDTIWAFYTCNVGVYHAFERRIGLDPIGIDADGELFSRGASEIPQLAPGARAEPVHGNDAGLLPVTMNKPVLASSTAPGREAIYAVDHCMRTWWEPAPGDPSPTLSVWFEKPFRISAARVIWRDEGMDLAIGVRPGPFRYRIEAEIDGAWRTVVDRSNNETDMLIEYATFDEVSSDRARLVVVGSPKGIRPAVTGFTVFGTGG